MDLHRCKNCGILTNSPISKNCVLCELDGKYSEHLKTRMEMIKEEITSHFSNSIYDSFSYQKGLPIYSQKRTGYSRYCQRCENLCQELCNGFCDSCSKLLKEEVW